jgi:hypothetical protein
MEQLKFLAIRLQRNILLSRWRRNQRHQHSTRISGSLLLLAKHPIFRL